MFSLGEIQTLLFHFEDYISVLATPHPLEVFFFSPPTPSLCIPSMQDIIGQGPQGKENSGIVSVMLA